ncbi:MAG: tetratricopeptide repeat protein [candidate division FCPU426 bacterium]
MSKQAWDAFKLFKEGQLQQASSKYQQILEKEPANISVLNMLGEIAVRQGQWVEALRYFRLSLKLPNESEAKAETIRKKMIRLDPDSVEDMAAESESPAPASDSFQASLEKMKGAIAADPKNLENYQKLGDFLEQNGRRKEAAEQLLVVGNALFNNKAFKKAGEIFKRIASLDAACLPAHIALGEIYSKEGSDSDAKKEFLYVAEQLIRQGNLERGQLFAQKAIQLKSIEAHYYLGLVYLLTRQTEEARKELETLLKFKVNHQSGLTQLASLFGEQKQWDDAVKLYERLIKIDARNAYASERIAAIALQTNQPNQAEEKYIQAMDSYAANEDWELATFCALEAVRLDQHNQELYLKLADAAYNADLEGQAAEACLALADLKEAEGKTNEAQELRNKARELQGGAKVESAPPREKTPPPAPKAQPAADEMSVMLNMADTYIQQGALDEAIEIYQKILKREPNNQKVRTALTRVYAMFAGLNPETAVARKSQPPAAGTREPDEQRVQREARERAIREAQVRAQRTTAPETAAAKPTAKEDEWLQTVGNARGDEIAGDHQDEFMTVTVAEIYTKQGLLNEALKIYQKILEMEPGNMEAQVKKQQLEAKLAEQEKIRQQVQEAQAAPKAAAKDQPAKEPAAKESPKPEPATPAPPAKEPAPGQDQNGGDEPPAGKGRRGRVSYV